MAIAVVRRVVFGLMAAWAFVMAAEEARFSGHGLSIIGFAVAGVVLGLGAVTGKGG